MPVPRPFEVLALPPAAIFGNELAVPRSGALRQRRSGRLSHEAEQLLREAIEDPHGTVLSLDTLGGSHVQTNEKDFVVANDPRSEALWKGAVEELVDQGFLKQRDVDGEVFTVTNHGYRAGDQIRSG
jgi:hypothetical protein